MLFGFEQSVCLCDDGVYFRSRCVRARSHTAAYIARSLTVAVASLPSDDFMTGHTSSTVSFPVIHPHHGRWKMGRRPYYGGLIVREQWSHRFLPPCLPSHWMRPPKQEYPSSGSFSLVVSLEYCTYHGPSSDSLQCGSCVVTWCSLYGLSVHQAYRYIRSFQTDAAYIRLLVSI